MPQLGESIVEATIVRWLVKPGDVVTRGQMLAEVETDKATSAIPAPHAGRVEALLAEEGETVSVGVAILGLEAAPTSTPTLEATSTPRPTSTPTPTLEPTLEATPRPTFTPTRNDPAAPAPSSVAPDGPRSTRLPSQHLAPRGTDTRGGPIRSSPSVRRIARRFALDLGAISGTGRGGRVTRSDVLRAIATPPPPSAPPPIARAEATPFATAFPAPIEEPISRAPEARSRRGPYRPPSYKVQRGDRVVPFSRRRAQIAGHMRYSLDTAAHVVAVAEIDMSRVMAARQADAPSAEQRGIKLTFMPYVVLAVARALIEHPELNATVLGDALVLREERNVGVAVDTTEGLVVPVIHRADELGLLGVARRIEDLSQRARAGTLTPDDVSGGSFTISNPGRDGNLFGVSVIRQPEVGILRMGAIVKRPVVREIEGEEAIVIRPMMYAALSYDHRVIDGRSGNAFLHRVAALLAAARPQSSA